MDMATIIQLYKRENRDVENRDLHVENRDFTCLVERSSNKTVIDFNFGLYKDLSTLKNDIHFGLLALGNITLSGR